MSDSTKKAAASKREAVPKKPLQHPAYKDMISEAIRNLKERNGSSRQKIAKFLETNYKGLGDESTLKRNLKVSLKKMVAGNSLVQTKGVGASGSFKLPASAKKPVAAKKPATTKKVSITKKPAAAKKPVMKKATAGKKSPAKKTVNTGGKKVTASSKSPKKPKAKIAKKPKATSKGTRSPTSKKAKGKAAIKKTTKNSTKQVKTSNK